MITGAETHLKTRVDVLIERLYTSDRMGKKSARHRLVRLGPLATPALARALTASNKAVRWEAAKALLTTGDPAGAAALVQALSDKSFEVRWLAAEALVNIGEPALQPLILRLLVESDTEASYDVRHGARHVLSDMKRNDALNEECLQLLKALCTLNSRSSVPAAAKKALMSFERNQ